MTNGSNTINWDVISAVAGVLGVIVGVFGVVVGALALEWQTIRPRLVKLLRLKVKSERPPPKFTRVSVLAAASATVSVVSVSFGAIVVGQALPDLERDREC